MKTLGLVLVLAFFSGLSLAENTVFVSGNNESAQTIRKQISKGKSCFVLAEDKDHADSILEVAENREGWPLVKVSGTLSSQTGAIQFAKTRGAAEGLFADMKKAVCH